MGCQMGFCFVHHEQIGCKKLRDAQGGVWDCDPKVMFCQCEQLKGREKL